MGQRLKRVTLSDGQSVRIGDVTVTVIRTHGDGKVLLGLASEHQPPAAAIQAQPRRGKPVRQTARTTR